MKYWKARTKLADWRNLARQSRRLTRERAVEVQQDLIRKLSKLGIIGAEAEFEDVLLLTVEDVLKRRLQTLVYEKGLASTMHQARQYIVHGHIQVVGKKIDAPSYLVKLEEEDFIDFTPSSPLSKPKETTTTSEA
ncbi:MAG: 30S ribosomal protein S4 [Promethearchaeota archaeon]